MRLKSLVLDFCQTNICVGLLSFMAGGFISCSLNTREFVFESYYEKLQKLSSMQALVVGSAATTGYTTTTGRPLSIEDVESITGCTAARLNPDGVVITSALEWKIFATCVLRNWNIRKPLPDQSAYRAYPPIQATNQKNSAYDFLVDALTNIGTNYDIFEMSADEQTNIYQYFLVVTKFQFLSSDSEYQSVRSEIVTKGLSPVLEKLINNWHASDLYARHFDYSKSPGGRYRMARLWGTINGRDGLPVEGAAVEIVDTNIKGHVTSTTTTSSQNRVKTLRMLFDEDAALYASAANNTNTFQHNFGLQFYMPLDQFTRNKRGKITDNTIEPDPTVTLRISGRGYSTLIQEVTIKHRFTHPNFPHEKWRNDVEAELLSSGDITLDLDILRIELTQISGGKITLDDIPDRTRLTGDASDFRSLFGNSMPPAGDYKSIKVFFGNANRKTIKNVTSNLYFNPANQNIWLLEGNFTLEGGMLTEFILEDFDFSSSLVRIRSDIFLRLNSGVNIQSVKSFSIVQDECVKNVLGDETPVMIKEADVILQGRAVSYRVGMANDYYGRKQVYTFYTIQAQSPMKGSMAGQTFTLQVIGGRIPNSNIEIVSTHMPKFTMGEDTILFLKHYVDKMGVLRGYRGKIDL